MLELNFSLSFLYKLVQKRLCSAVPWVRLHIFNTAYFQHSTHSMCNAAALIEKETKQLNTRRHTLGTQKSSRLS